MSTAEPRELLLGCPPQQVRVVLIEDGGNLVLQVFATEPATTDIDALFFSFADGFDTTGLTIFPEYDEAIGSNGENVTGFDVAMGALNQMNNGAQIQDSYDVRLEFGTLPYSSAGDVDQAALTFYIYGGGQGLTVDDIDLSSMTAVINSDSGNGLAMVGGVGADPQTVETIVLSEDFDGLSYASQSDNVQWNEGWRVSNGELNTDGCADGEIWFEPVASSGDTEISFDARAPHTEYFESGGCYGDSLEVWVLVDGSQWHLLDTFEVNADGTALVGDTTGQTITADMQTLTYEGGALDGAESIQLVLDADISASNEDIYIDNVTFTDTELVDGESGGGVCLLVNGDLESDTAPNTWELNGNPVGWTNDNGGIETWGDGYLGYDASSGNSYIELDRSNDDQVDNLYQDVQTEEGQTYTLTFDAAQRGIDSDSIEVYWNGELVSTVSPEDQDWESFEVTVTGTGGLDRLEFRELASENDCTGPLMDNICLVEAADCLLVNGDLESDTAAGAWELNGNPVGWTNDNGGIETWGDGHNGYEAASGDSFVELDRNAGHEVDNLYQDVQTEEGEAYTLTFDAAQRGIDSDSIEVYWNGELVSTVSPEDQDWESFEVTVTGTGGLDRLEFRELASESDGTGPLMDNICLVEADDGTDAGDAFCDEYAVTYDEFMKLADAPEEDQPVDDMADDLIL